MIGGMGSKKRVRSGDPNKAIGIVRVSTKGQRDIGAEKQRDELAQWAKANGVQLIAVYEDIGVSSAAPLEQRGGLLYAIQELKRHGAGTLLAVKGDRLDRDPHVKTDIERAVWNAGARIVTTDGIYTGKDNDAEFLQTGFDGLMRAQVLRTICERNKKRAEKCIEQGRTHGGLLPYGYMFAAKGKIGRGGKVVDLTENPEEQKVIALMRKLRASEVSYDKIAKELNARGYVARKGPWAAIKVMRVLERVGE